jgi:hypothetical protein
MYFSRLLIVPFTISILVAGQATLRCGSFLQSSKPSADDQNRVSLRAKENEAQEINFYKNAHSYIDEPLSRLKGILPELDGLKPGDNPQPLAGLLTTVASKTYDFAEKVPNLISDELVTESQWPTSSTKKAACLACPDPGPIRQRVEKYNYIILARPAQDHHLVLEEDRTDRNGRPVPINASPRFRGFSMFWVIFSASHQQESRFRYLGQQKIDGRTTFVVGFAQLPGLVENPAKIAAAKTTIPMLLQGIAWIDSNDFHILRLHTDLLAPQPEIGYLKQTSDLRYGTMRITALNVDLWAPRIVEVETDDAGELWHEQHEYSKYRLYQAKSKIILSPEN